METQGIHHYAISFSSIFIPGKIAGTLAALQLLSHVWRATACMATSSSHWEIDDVNVCRHLTHHRKAKHWVKMSLVRRCEMCGESQITEELPMQGPRQARFNRGRLACSVQAFPKPTLECQQDPEIQNYELFNLTFSMTSSFVTWGCHTLIPLGFTEECFFRCILYFE